MQVLVLYAMCTAALFYLGSRAVITSLLWSKYNRRLAIFMDCAACSGTWYAGLVGYLGGYHLGLSFMGLPGDRASTVAAVALCGMTFTPIAAGLMQWGFDKLGTAIAEPEAAPPPASAWVAVEVKGDPAKGTIPDLVYTASENDGTGPKQG